MGSLGGKSGKNAANRAFITWRDLPFDHKQAV
jgi:hypothetical protein